MPAAAPVRAAKQGTGRCNCTRRRAVAAGRVSLQQNEAFAEVSVKIAGWPRGAPAGESWSNWASVSPATSACIKTRSPVVPGRPRWLTLPVVASNTRSLTGEAIGPSSGFPATVNQRRQPPGRLFGHNPPPHGSGNTFGHSSTIISIIDVTDQIDGFPRIGVSGQISRPGQIPVC